MSNHPVVVIDPALSVNELLRRYPVALRVLNAFGVETCCGGALSLAEVTAESGVSCADVSQAIVAVVESTRLEGAAR